MTKTTSTTFQGTKILTKWTAVLALGGISAGVLAVPVDQVDKLNGLLNDLQPKVSLEPQLNSKDIPVDPSVQEDLKAALKLYQEGQYAPAITKAQTALTAAPNSSIACELLGASQLKLGAFDQGISNLLKASRLSPENATPLIWIGDAYLTRGDLAQARKYFQMILDKKPDQPEGHQGLGLVSEREGKLDEAVSHFEAGIVGMPPTAYGVKVNLARTFNRQFKFDKTIALLGDLAGRKPANDSAIEMLAIAYLGAGKPAEAIQTYQLAYATAPTAPLALGLGIAYRQSNNLAESLKYLKEATSMRANWDTAWIQLAETQILSADLTGALASLNKARAVAAQPAVVDARVGDVYLLQKDYPKAIATFEQLMAAKEGDPAIRDRLGTAYQTKGDIASAERTFKDSAKRSPADPLPPYRLGLLYDQSNRYPEAIAELNKAAALDKENPEVQRALVVVCNKAGQRPRAIEIAEQLVQKQPAVLESKIILASLYTQNGDDRRAIVTYRDVLKTNPDQVIALNNLGMALARSGEFDEAIRLARHAVSLIPKSGQLLDSLGWITYLQGEFAPAADVLQKSAALSPNDPSIHYHLGMAYWKQNQKTPALDSFKRALSLSKDFPEYKQATEMIELAGKEPK